VCFVKEHVFNMAHNFTNSEMCDMVFIYIRSAADDRGKLRKFTLVDIQSEDSLSSIFYEIGLKAAKK